MAIETKKKAVKMKYLREKLFVVVELFVVFIKRCRVNVDNNLPFNEHLHSKWSSVFAGLHLCHLPQISTTYQCGTCASMGPSRLTCNVTRTEYTIHWCHMYNTYY